MGPRQAPAGRQQNRKAGTQAGWGRGAEIRHYNINNDNGDNGKNNNNSNNNNDNNNNDSANNNNTIK